MADLRLPPDPRVRIYPKKKKKRGSADRCRDRDGTFDTANPPYIRKYLRTYGLTPPRAESYEVQQQRGNSSLALQLTGSPAHEADPSSAALAQLAAKSTPLEQYLYLSTIRKNNVHLFYRLMTDHIKVR
jgi:malate dehydrogenase (oxaloacetate-decarboxylating)(NADP+)